MKNKMMKVKITCPGKSPISFDLYEIFKENFFRFMPEGETQIAMIKCISDLVILIDDNDDKLISYHDLMKRIDQIFSIGNGKHETSLEIIMPEKNFELFLPLWLDYTKNHNTEVFNYVNHLKFLASDSFEEKAKGAIMYLRNILQTQYRMFGALSQMYCHSMEMRYEKIISEDMVFSVQKNVELVKE